MSIDEAGRQLSETPLLDNVQHDETASPLQLGRSPSVASASSHKSWRRAVAYFRSQTSSMDMHGSNWYGIFLGLFLLALVGTLLGLVLPKNETLPTLWYRYISNMIGYTYFMCWSVSFYPQVFTNLKRRSTRGLSPDFCGLNVIGFACYAAYNVSFYYSHNIQDLYRQRHGANAELTVQSNDVAFAVHALILSSVAVFQIAYFDGIRALRPSRVIGFVMCGILSTCVVVAAVVSFNIIGGLNWLDYLYMLSFIKIGITLIKYIPQAVLNFRRKSTVGWSIWNVLLDFSGGLLSDLQLVLDCADLRDFTGITGNLAKFGLGFVSMSFDVLFILQHYVFYRNSSMADDYSPMTIQTIREEKTDAAVV